MHQGSTCGPLIYILQITLLTFFAHDQLNYTHMIPIYLVTMTEFERKGYIDMELPQTKSPYQ